MTREPPPQRARTSVNLKRAFPVFGMQECCISGSPWMIKGDCVRDERAPSTVGARALSVVDEAAAVTAGGAGASVVAVEAERASLQMYVRTLLAPEVATGRFATEWRGAQLERGAWSTLCPPPFGGTGRGRKGPCDPCTMSTPTWQQGVAEGDERGNVIGVGAQNVVVEPEDATARRSKR